METFFRKDTSSSRGNVNWPHRLIEGPVILNHKMSARDRLGLRHFK